MGKREKQRAKTGSDDSGMSYLMIIVVILGGLFILDETGFGGKLSRNVIKTKRKTACTTDDVMALATEVDDRTKDFIRCGPPIWMPQERGEQLRSRREPCMGFSTIAKPCKPHPLGGHEQGYGQSTGIKMHMVDMKCGNCVFHDAAGSVAGINCFPPKHREHINALFMMGHSTDSEAVRAQCFRQRDDFQECCASGDPKDCPECVVGAQAQWAEYLEPLKATSALVLKETEWEETTNKKYAMAALFGVVFLVLGVRHARGPWKKSKQDKSMEDFLQEEEKEASGRRQFKTKSGKSKSKSKSKSKVQ